MSQQIEQMLKARSIDFDFEPNVKIRDPDVEGNQVRLTEHRAPKDQVAKYAVAMKHGATFPAIVLNDRLERIDGNTRLEARDQERGRHDPRVYLPSDSRRSKRGRCRWSSTSPTGWR